MAQKDRIEKILEEYNDVFADIVNVLYFGMNHWEAPQTVHEAVLEKAPRWQRVLELVPDYRMNLIEVAFLPQEVREKFTSDFRIIAEYFYAKRTKTEKEFFLEICGMMQLCRIIRVIIRKEKWRCHAVYWITLKTKESVRG